MLSTSQGKRIFFSDNEDFFYFHTSSASGNSGQGTVDDSSTLELGPHEAKALQDMSPTNYYVISL